MRKRQRERLRMPEQTNKNKNLPFLIRKGEQEDYKMTEKKGTYYITTPS